MRIGYIDGMRGLAIVLVVLGHVLLLVFKIDGGGLLAKIISSFHMQLFFFISGYVAYGRRPLSIHLEIKRKFKTLILPAVLFYSAYWIVNDMTYEGVMNRGGGIFHAYWFTFVLFEFFIVYWLCCWVGKRTSEKVSILLLAAVSLICAFLVGYGFIDGTQTTAKYFELVRFTLLLQFFAMGIICRRYNTFFMKVVSHDIFRGLCFLMLAVAMTILFKGNLTWPCWTLLWVIQSSVPYFAVLLIFSLFHYYEQVFSNDLSKWARILCFIGRRTLDVYFVHYFFLPRMPWMATWLSDDVTLQLFSGIIIAVPVIATSLLVGQIIRSSHFLSRYLLGTKD